ncbi:MAG: hypothetical protein QNK23_10490 [Crocinitomicaceae bacterium]|nr:hypothetical protein [Crocinitomicaceae bacterium]
MMLYSNDIIEEIMLNKDEELDEQYLPLGLMVGSKLRFSPTEDKKGIISKKVARFVNESIQAFGYELGPHGQIFLINMVGEILGNAEDHSAHSNYFVNGVAFRRDVKNENLEVELNLAIVNFGYSIYDGLRKTASKNPDQQRRINKLFSTHEALIKSKKRSDLSKEALYTLYSLQQGVSRLKYEGDGRGNGTMNFIKNFMRLGVSKSNEKFSNLSVVSGRSSVLCSKDYAPHPNPNDKSMYQLSLNSENKLTSLPDKGRVKSIDQNFPGTILQVKILMNKENFEALLKENES